MQLTIAIPTYNRCEFLKTNIEKLSSIIERNNFISMIEIVISDNHSDDATLQKIQECVKEHPLVSIRFYQNKRNLGYSRNVLEVLKRSTGKYVMFLGDDDFIEESYLLEIMRILREIKAKCIIPSYKNISLEGEDTGRGRDIEKKSKFYTAGFWNCFINSWRGHQLSGLVLFRENLFEACIEKDIDNLYPQIFMVSYSCLRYATYHFTSAPVLVMRPTQDNKNWTYGDDGLLTHVFDNYAKLEYISRIQRSILESKFLVAQYWRCGMYLKKGFGKYLKCLKSVSVSSNVTLFNRIFIWVEIPIIFVCQTLKLLFTGKLFETLRVKVDI